ncbi:RTX toxin [Labilithrix luteola]|uniref:RTX toxin n=1 Tax=Labilithrix luteola TaxID=1391654 RepID=A0A0K1Q9T0_9BACT|nr:hypothetical protein [Labilithrix luteola]AKV02170.1 RTX toxin [Labilithrix luteola]
MASYFRSLFSLGSGLVLVSIVGTGCASILGFDETTVRTEPLPGADGGGLADVDGGSTEGGSTEPGAPTLSVSPVSVVVRRAGATSTVTVTVDRNDVTGPLNVSVNGLPQGVTASGSAIPEGASQASIVLTATKSAALGGATATFALDGTSSSENVHLLVADASGAFDTTFGDHGFVKDDARGTRSIFYGLAVAADGKVVAGGIANTDPLSPGGWLVRRFSASGALETAFAPTLPTDGEVRAVAIDAAGRIVVVGASSAQAGAPAQMTVVRLTSAGVVDTSFGGGPVRLFAVADAPAGSEGFGVAFQPDGAVLVAGVRHDVGSDSGVVARLTDAGKLDTTFNSGKPLVVTGHSFVGVAPGTNGSIVAGGTSGSGGSFSVVSRTAAGASDTTFGQNGELAFGIGFHGLGFARAADGTFALVGDSSASPTLYTAGVATSGGVQAWVRGVANGTGASAFHGVTVQDDGKIVAVGHTAVMNGEARVTRLLSNGSVDETFATAGTAFIEPPGSANGIDVSLYATTVQVDGRILAAGARANAGAAIYRIWP